MSLQTVAPMTTSRHSEFDHMKLKGWWPTAERRASEALLDKIQSDHDGYCRAYQDHVARNGRAPAPPLIALGVTLVLRRHAAAKAEQLKRLQQQ